MEARQGGRERRIMTDMEFTEEILPLKDRKALYTPREVAELARVDPKTVMGWIHEGSLAGIRLSTRIYRIPLGAVIKLLYPEQVRRPPVRRRGRIPVPGAGEHWIAKGRGRRAASA